MSGAIKVDENVLISIMKINKLLLIGDVETKINEYIEYKIDTKNVLNFYELANCFSLCRSAKAAFICVERCFTVVVESQSFLELCYASLSRILASSGLLITSELEIYSAANAWLGYNDEKRSKFAEDILQKVRLHLLSVKT